jgi:DNA-binding MarR family transcriptional regulator
MKTAQPNQGASGDAQLAREVWGQMYEVFMENRPAFMAVCREFDLFPPQVMVLRSLDEPKRMREIAEILACDSSNVTGITDRLEERGLVQRTAAESDRRVKLLVLTKEGRALRREIHSRLSVPPESIAGLPAADLRRLEEILGRALATEPA